MENRGGFVVIGMHAPSGRPTLAVVADRARRSCISYASDRWRGVLTQTSEDYSVTTDKELLLIIS